MLAFAWKVCENSRVYHYKPLGSSCSTYQCVQMALNSTWKLLCRILKQTVFSMSKNYIYPLISITPVSLSFGYALKEHLNINDLR